MVLLPAKQASEPSPKLIIVATHTHGNNGGHGIAMLHLVADPGPSDGPTGCGGESCQNGPKWKVSLQCKWCCCLPSKPQNPLQSLSLLPGIFMATMDSMT